MALRCLSKIWRPSWHKHVTEGTNSWWAVGGHFGCIASVRGARFSSLCALLLGFFVLSLMWCSPGRLWPDPMS